MDLTVYFMVLNTLIVVFLESWIFKITSYSLNNGTKLTVISLTVAALKCAVSLQGLLTEITAFI